MVLIWILYSSYCCQDGGEKGHRGHQGHHGNGFLVAPTTSAGIHHRDLTAARGPSLEPVAWEEGRREEGADGAAWSD